jgi:hypothetical protein
MLPLSSESKSKRGVGGSGMDIGRSKIRPGPQGIK